MSSSNDFANQNNQLHPSNDPESERQPVSRPTKQLKSLRNRIAALVGRARTDRFVGSGGSVAYAICGSSKAAHTLAFRVVHERTRLSNLLPSRAVSLGIVAAAMLALPSAASAADPCPNAEVRTGPSAKLPDCRAYELVSVPDSAGLAPVGVNSLNHANWFQTDLISPDGESVMFQSSSGALPGFPGNGLDDRYLSTRTASGWETDVAGPLPAESEQPNPGGMTAEHDYQFVEASITSLPDRGSLFAPWDGVRNATDWIRDEDGNYELIGKGSLADEPRAVGNYISPGAEHIIFSTHFEAPTPLEPGAPNEVAVYDRSLDGPTKLISLLPGEVTPAAGSYFQGASEDGSLVAFSVGTNSISSDLYLRVDNDHTDPLVLNNNRTFAGIYGRNAFWVNEGLDQNPESPNPAADLFSYNPDTEQVTQITNTNDARFVNISADGSRVYFVSPSQIGGQGTAGQQNLYLWDRDDGTTTFVATVDDADVTGDHDPEGATGQTNLANLIYTRIQGPAFLGSRITDDGSVLAFQSVAALTGEDTDGLAQVYRYDAESDELDCVSCQADGGTSGGRSFLQTATTQGIRVVPTNQHEQTQSLSADGSTVVFDSFDALVPRDKNGHRDVYRWTEEDGAQLISTGQSDGDSYLYDASPDLSDIIIWTPEDLVAGARNAPTQALYDARVGGGFPDDAQSELPPCVGDECQSGPTSPPAEEKPGSANEQPGNVEVDTRRCKSFERKADTAAAKSRKLKRKARKAKSKKRAKALRKRATKQNQRAKRFEAKASACWKGSK